MALYSIQDDMPFSWPFRPQYGKDCIWNHPHTLHCSLR